MGISNSFTYSVNCFFSPFPVRSSGLQVTPSNDNVFIEVINLFCVLFRFILHAFLFMNYAPLSRGPETKVSKFA